MSRKTFDEALEELYLAHGETFFDDKRLVNATLKDMIGCDIHENARLKAFMSLNADINVYRELKEKGYSAGKDTILAASKCGEDDSYVMKSIMWSKFSADQREEHAICVDLSFSLKSGNLTIEKTPFSFIHYVTDDGKWTTLPSGSRHSVKEECGNITLYYPETPCGCLSVESRDGNVEVNADIKCLSIRSENGNIHVRGRCGGYELETKSGNICVDMKPNGRNGTICLSAVSSVGNIDVNTGGLSRKVNTRGQFVRSLQCGAASVNLNLQSHWGNISVK